MEKMKRMRIKRIILVIALAVLIVALAVLPVIAKENAVHDGPQQSILRGVVETGNITTCLKGGGILMEETPENITVPDSVKLTGFLVANGDMVRPGDPIAQVDPVTVMAAIADTQQKLDLLATQMQGVSTENTATKLNANAGGVVKAAYAQKGQSVQDVILEHDCLAVLSLSGRMAVQVETENLILAGTGVNVIFENGTIIPAQIDSCLDGQLTVSFGDKNYEPGTHVMIQSEEGVILGSGVLVIRDPLRLLAAEGMVSRVAVSKGQRVDINDVLLELTDAGKPAEYDSILAQRQEQEALLQTLISLHYTGVVTAPCDGVISGIKENCPALLYQKAQGEDDLPDSLSPELLTQLEQKNTDLFIAAVTPQQWVTVTITVDEQDVLRLKPGMEAVVRIPALSEDIMTATVREVSAEGKNQGGSSKFSVKLKLPHGEKMLAGMHVIVAIPVETVTDVKQIPVAAVVNLGSKTVVYRGYDGDKETFTDPVEVVLGRSDGIYVEVISGLNAGEVFYYGYYDTLELSDEPDFGVLPFVGH